MALKDFIDQHCGLQNTEQNISSESILQSSWWHCLNHTYCQNSLIKHVSPQPKLIFKQDSTDSRMVPTTLTSFTVYTVRNRSSYLSIPMTVLNFPFLNIINLKHRFHQHEVDCIQGLKVLKTKYSLKQCSSKLYA